MVTIEGNWPAITDTSKKAEPMRPQSATSAATTTAATSTPYWMRRDHRARWRRVSDIAALRSRRLLPDPVLVDLVVGAVALDAGQGLVDLVDQGAVVLAHADAVVVAGV